MNWPNLEEFEAMVIDALDALPDEMVEGLDNVVFLVEEEPEEGHDILGLYDGVALTERASYGFGELPDRITVYRRTLIEHCQTPEELREEIHITLVHEIAHYYGLSDEQLHELGWG